MPNVTIGDDSLRTYRLPVQGRRQPLKRGVDTGMLPGFYIGGAISRGAFGAEWGREWVGGIPSPDDYGVWVSVVSSLSGVRGEAPTANAFLAYLRSTEHFWYRENTVTLLNDVQSPKAAC